MKKFIVAISAIIAFAAVCAADSSNVVKVGGKYYVEDENATVLGRYDSGDREAAVAAVEKDGWKSVFCGSFHLTVEFLRGTAAWAGVNCFADTGDVVYADGALAVFHASEDGEKTLTLPKKCDVYDYFSGQWHKGVQTLSFTAQAGETRYFFYGRQADLQSCGIGREE